VARKRQTDADRTVKKIVDVAAAFSVHEVPTRPAVRELVPLDAVPILALERSDLPWDELTELATQLLLRVDGQARAMDIVSGNAGTPGECASVLAALARRGLLRLKPPRDARADEGVPLEIDLSVL
jgi:hypothetical protein